MKDEAVVVYCDILVTEPRDRLADIVDGFANSAPVRAIVTLTGRAAMADLKALLVGGPAGGILPVLMAAFVLTSLGYVAGYLALIVGRQGRFVGIAAAALVINVVLNVILLPRYGYQAAAWVTLASEVIVIAAATRTTFPVLGLRVAPASKGAAESLGNGDRSLVRLLDRRVAGA